LKRVLDGCSGEGPWENDKHDKLVRKSYGTMKSTIMWEKLINEVPLYPVDQAKKYRVLLGAVCSTGVAGEDSP
jgi:hypothetical protein